ncbi:unnamed protein product [Porites lobata]|uniref:MADF domain-containing protein n=1 Tax=Porites lobata TaxID=104759 RepID=A0ABN8NV33_9CNID|nr:unnamed protein product [Porites lobata]
MEWTEQKDVMLAREILLCEPFKYRAGSKERGSVWSQIATNLNTHPGFTVSQRAVRDPKKRKREIENGTGISPEDSELDLALEEIIEKWEAADQEFQLDNQSKAKKLEKDKETAEEMRRMSMETLGASKKRKSDPDESAEEKREMEFRFKREELEAKKSEQSLLTEQQKQQQQMISMFQQQLQQQNQQQQLQQQQMQQQLQQMQTMFMESQKQQAQLMATLFQKMSEQK